MLNQVLVRSIVPSRCSAISGLSLAMSLEVAVEEDVAPIEQRPGLVLERAAGLPSAEHLRGQAAVAQERLGLAERQLVDRAAAETPRPRVLARLPQRRLAIVGFDRPVLVTRRAANARLALRPAE